MNRIIIVFLFVVAGISGVAQSHSNIEFIENKGQWDSQVNFHAKLFGGDLWVENKMLTFNYHSEQDREKYHQIHHGEIPYDSNEHFLRMHSFQMKFIDSSTKTNTISNSQNRNYYNYFLGNDSSKWASNVSSYQDLEIENIYNGIDLLLHSDNGQLKYDIRIAPFSDPTSIRIKFDGASGVIKEGDLHFALSVGEVLHSSPIAFQLINDEKKYVKCNYQMKEEVLSFEFPDGYNENYELIIDPTLVYSTFTGSIANNFGFTATYDDEGNLYAGGIVYDIGYPTTIGAYQTSFEGFVDIGITKFNEVGTELIYSTYLGGSENDFPQSMMVDNNNNLCIFGSTVSSNFPVTQNTFQTEINYSCDIIVSKLSSNGDELIASTFLGGSDRDGSTGNIMASHNLSLNYADSFRGEIIIDSDNTIYIASYTYSNDFPITGNAHKDTLGGQMDGVIVHLSEDLDALLFSTYIGGSDIDVLNSIKKKGELIIAGGATKSSDYYTTSNVLNSEPTGSEYSGVILSIDENGNVLSSSYLGNGDKSIVYLIEIGPDDHVYALGFCSGNYAVTENVYANAYSQQFIQEMDHNLSTSIQSTSFGSSDSIFNHFSPTAFMIDDCGLIYVSGHISFNSVDPDTEFPVTPNALQDSTDGKDFYFIVFNKDFESLLMATYFGEFGVADHVDGGTSRFNKDGVIYQAVCAGCSGTSGFPTTPGVWSETNNSTHCNLAALKIDMEAQDVDANVFIPDTLVCGGNPPFAIQFDHEGRAAPFYFWDFGDGNTSNLQDPINFYEEAGTYTIKHIVIDSTTCISSDTASATFEISFIEDFIMDWNVSPPLNCKDTLYVALEFSGQSADSLVWDMGDGTIFHHNPVFYQYDVPGSYELSLEAYDLDCDNEGVFSTEFYLEEGLISSKIGVPNIFSPNGDGINDFFQLYYLSIPQDDPLNYIENLSMKIYNRWGRLIYESSSNPSSWKWNGESNDNVVSEGIYFYIIEFKSLCEGGGIEKFAGSVTLVRE